MKRMFGEWSVAFDTLVVLKLYEITKAIAKSGIAPDLNRELSPSRQDFLRNFAKAQMITYEAAELGTSVGWFYWNFKMEGGVFAEWDFLRGIKEGWLPKIPPRNVSSEEAFQTTCHNLIFQTDDNMDVVKEYPDPHHLPPNTWFGDDIDDDVVISHGDSLINGKKTDSTQPSEFNGEASHHWTFIFVALAFCGLAYVYLKRRGDRKGYTQVASEVVV